MIKKNISYYICYLLIVIILPCLISCNTCQYYFFGEIEFQVKGITLSTYDKTNDHLISESNLSGFDATQSGSFSSAPTAYSLSEANLEINATTNDSESLYIRIGIGDKFNDLKLNDTVEDSIGAYLEIYSFDIDNTSTTIRYESDDTVTISLQSDGYHVVFREFTYEISETEEKEYGDTLEIEVVFDDLVTLEDTVERIHMCD